MHHAFDFISLHTSSFLSWSLYTGSCLFVLCCLPGADLFFCFRLLKPNLWSLWSLLLCLRLSRSSLALLVMMLRFAFACLLHLMFWCCSSACFSHTCWLFDAFLFLPCPPFSIWPFFTLCVFACPVHPLVGSIVVLLISLRISITSTSSCLSTLLFLFFDVLLPARTFDQRLLRFLVSVRVTLWLPSLSNTDAI